MTGKAASRRARGIDRQRRAARLAAVQALYQMDMAGSDLVEVIGEFEAGGLGQGGDDHDKALFRAILTGVFEQQRRIDLDIHGTLAEGWKLERLDSTLRAILRAGTYELLCRRKVSAKTVIHEYLEIAHAFYDGSEPGFVNAALDSLARKLRARELGHDAASAQ